MPSISSPRSDAPIRDDLRARRARIDRLDRMADALDAKFRIFGFPVGWDSILGLIPGVGDVVTAGPGAIMIYEAGRMGVRKRTMARMAANTGVDMVLGGIPVLGDVFDLFFKSHRRNMDILKRELARIEAGAPNPEGDDVWQPDHDRNGTEPTRRPSASAAGSTPTSTTTWPSGPRT